MSKKEKLIYRLEAKPKDFTWDELLQLLNYFGYDLVKHGKTSGSRRKFIHKKYGLISLHEPHPTKVLKRYQVDLVLKKLEEEGLL